MEDVAEKWKTIKSMALGKKKELADGYYELKKKELGKTPLFYLNYYVTLIINEI